MKPDMVKKYLILVAVLALCAGALWYMSNTSVEPAKDAVLAWENRGRETAQIDLDATEGETFEILTALRKGGPTWQ